MSRPPVALSVAGSDSGAGAGIQADLKAMAAQGVLATTAVTAVTAQNTVAVTAVHVVPPAVVGAQIDAVLDDLPVAAAKTGLLATAATVDVVAERATAGRLPHLVVDPVLAASSGRVLVEPDVVTAYRERLLPRALLVTPNLWEAVVLASGGAPPDRVDVDAATGVADMEALARRILDLGPRWVLVKGGHLPGVVRDGAAAEASGGPAVPPPGTVADVLVDAAGATVLEAPWVATRNTHGTGCTLSATICALLARGVPVPEAVARAKEAVHRALVGAAGWDWGAGHGPLDPLDWSRPGT